MLPGEPQRWGVCVCVGMCIGAPEAVFTEAGGAVCPVSSAHTHAHVLVRGHSTPRDTQGASGGAPTCGAGCPHTCRLLAELTGQQTLGLPRLCRLQSSSAHGRRTAWQALWQPAASEPPSRFQSPSSLPSRPFPSPSPQAQALLPPVSHFLLRSLLCVPISI